MMLNRILIIAECGINHNGNMDTAHELILRAKEAGADIFKTQVYSVDALFPDHKIMAQGRNWYEEVKKTELTKEQVFQIAGWCKKIGIEFMASAFDIERVGWLDEVGVKRHKVAYMMRNNKPLIDAMVNTGQPVILSCNHLLSGGYVPGIYTRLYCVPLYPTELSELNLYKVRFDYMGYNGFSDHTIGVDASIIAMSRGAEIIEKHFTLDKNDKQGPDHICSAEPEEMRQIVGWARKIEETLV